VLVLALTLRLITHHVDKPLMKIDMIRLGIIGLGTMGKHILAGALAHAEFEVLSIFDIQIQHLSAPHLSGEQYLAIQFADSLDEMLSRDDIDLIYIGTPPDTYIQYCHLCHLCLDKGKTIWCEKPLAADIIQAQQLVSRIGEMKVKAAVNLPLDQVFQYVAKDSNQ
jgi:predicted dehydrogenase